MQSANYQRQIGLSIFRVLVSILVLVNLVNFLPYSGDFFGNGNIYPYSRYSEKLNNVGLSFLKYPFNAVFSAKLYLYLGITLSVFLLFGIFKQLTCLSLFLFLLILHLRNPFLYDGADTTIRVTLPFLAFADSYKYFSFNFLNIRIKNTIVELFLSQIKKYALIGFLIQVCIIYLVTALIKVHSDLWYNGTATYYTLRVEKYMASPLNIYLTQNIYFVTFSTYSVLLFELAFAFLIWFKKTKWYLLSYGVIFNLGIWFLMRIEVFPWIMIATYMVFITDEEYKLIYKKIQNKKNRLTELAKSIRRRNQH